MYRVKDEKGQEWVINKGDQYYDTLAALEKEGLIIKDLVLPRSLMMYGKSNVSSEMANILYEAMDSRQEIINAVVAYRLEHE